MLKFLQEHIWTILIVLNYALAFFAGITILLKNINPTKTITYIVVLAFIPVLGLIVYYFFGQDYRKDKIFDRKNVLNQSIIKSINDELKLNKQEFDELEHSVLDDAVKLVKLLHNTENSPFTKNNDVTLLKNGEEKFVHLLRDLKKAENHIHLEYYIFRDDDIGSKVIDVLCERAKEGVTVRVSKDDVGNHISGSAKRKLKKSGVEFYPFMPVLFPRFTGKMNYRNHRKIIVIDGKIGYVGGINISDEYNNTPDSAHYWRDTHLRIVGEAVKQLQIHFLMNWNFVSDNSLKITQDLFPETKCKNNIAVQIAASGPDTDWANIMEAIFLAAVEADEYVYITTPYFIPNEQIVTALQVAAKSGVDVRLLIPKISDSWTARYATNSYLERLMEANVRVYRYGKGFIHAKTMVVDDIFSTIGTSNMDYRSFNINFEINALIYDEGFTKQVKQHFFDDLEESEEVTYEDWLNRPKIDKLKESYSRLWAPLL